MRITLDIPFPVNEICRITDAISSPEIAPDAYIYAVCTDTRECRRGDLFIALDGENTSGEKYVSVAQKKECFIVSKSNACGVIQVTDTTDALMKISKAYKSKVSPKYTVAVTGSVGKSTTVRFISQILCQKYKVHSTVGNFNNHIGVPLTILSMPKSTNVLVTELGMNHRGEISRLSRTVEPDVGIITSIGTAHIGNLGSREMIAAAKLEILDGMSDNTILLPSNEPLLSGVNGGSYVGINSSLSDYSLDIDGNRLCFRSGKRIIRDLEFFSNQRHLLADLAYSIAIADILNLSDEEIRKGISAITESNLRQRFIILNDFTIFDDSYNASLESISADLIFISSLGRPTGAFLGDVLELGNESEGIHEKIGKVAASMNIGRLYLYGKYAECTARGALINGMDAKRIFINTDIEYPNISITQIKEHHVSGEVILFKASHRLRLDKIADSIKNEERISNG